MGIFRLLARTLKSLRLTTGYSMCIEDLMGLLMEGDCSSILLGQDEVVLGEYYGTARVTSFMTRTMQSQIKSKEQPS